MLIIPCKIPYMLPVKVGLLCLAFSAAAGGMFVHEALTNEQGLSIDLIINLDSKGATVFYWALAALSLLMFSVTIAAFVRRFVGPTEIVFEEAGVVLPYGLFQLKVVWLKYSSILEISETVVNHQRILNLYTHARRYSISGTLLPDQAVYEDVREFFLDELSIPEKH